MHLHIISETRSGSSCLAEIYSNNGYKIIEEHEWACMASWNGHKKTIPEIEEILEQIETSTEPIVFKNHWVDIERRLKDFPLIKERLYNLKAKKLCLLRRNKLEHGLSRCYSSETKHTHNIYRHDMPKTRKKIEIPINRFNKTIEGTIQEFKAFLNWAKSYGDEIVFYEDLTFPSNTIEQQIHPYSELITNLPELIDLYYNLTEPPPKPKLKSILTKDLIGVPELTEAYKNGTRVDVRF